MSTRKKSLAGVNKNREYSRIDIIRNAHCRRILGKPSGLCKEDEEILHAFCFTPDMTTDEIIEKTRENLWKYFLYKPIKVVKPQGIYFLQKVAGAFHSIGKVSTQYVRANSFYEKIWPRHSGFVYGAFKEISAAVCTAERSNRSEAICDSLLWKKHVF